MTSEVEPLFLHLLGKEIEIIKSKRPIEEKLIKPTKWQSYDIKGFRQ